MEEVYVHNSRSRIVLTLQDVDVNLTGNFALSQAAIPYMKVEHDEAKKKLPDSHVGRAGPCIINVSSFRGVISDPNQEGYAATKGMF